MVWFEIRHWPGSKIWYVYKVTGTELDETVVLFKQLKTENAARAFARKYWVRRWLDY